MLVFPYLKQILDMSFTEIGAVLTGQYCVYADMFFVTSHQNPTTITKKIALQPCPVSTAQLSVNDMSKIC